MADFTGLDMRGKGKMVEYVIYLVVITKHFIWYVISH